MTATQRNYTHAPGGGHAKPAQGWNEPSAWPARCENDFQGVPYRLSGTAGLRIIEILLFLRKPLKGTGPESRLFLIVRRHPYSHVAYGFTGNTLLSAEPTRRLKIQFPDLLTARPSIRANQSLTLPVQCAKYRFCLTEKQEYGTGHDSIVNRANIAHIGGPDIRRVAAFFECNSEITVSPIPVYPEEL